MTNTTQTQIVTISPRPDVLAATQSVLEALEAGGDLSAMPYYRYNEVLILTDRHAVSVWHERDDEEVLICHRLIGLQEGPWTAGIPEL